MNNYFNKDQNNTLDIDEDTVKFMLHAALTQSDAYPKALANFLFREIIEEAHVKYNISQEDIQSMCKQAVNRAALYIAHTQSKRPHTMQAFAIHAAGCNEWDNAEITDEIEREMDLIAVAEQILNKLD